MATISIGTRTDTTPKAGSDASLGRIRRRKAVRVRQAHIESALLLLVVASLIVLAGSSVGRWLATPDSQPTTRVTVQKGDTLWGLASRYGDPDEYILSRVDKLARRNQIRLGESLQPGDVLQVPIGNSPTHSRLARR